MPELPDTIAGYRLERKLSAGGMGMVYLASRTSNHGFEKQVAIKLLLPHFFDRDDLKQLFSDEARLAAQLSHPNICQVFDFGVEQQLYYLVMEYVDGVRVLDILRAEREREGHLPPQLAARIVADAARGLHFAHQLRSAQGEKLGVIHRDISPENIIVTTAGFTKVLDFGIARWEERVTETAGNVVRGKAAYMSPEQVQGGALDARSDIFALGILLHELLCSRSLFRRRNPVASMEAVISDPIPDLLQLNPALPEELTTVVARALQRDRSQRYESADQLTRALEEIIQKLGRPATSDSLAQYLQSVTLPYAHAPRVDGGEPPNAFTRDLAAIDGEVTSGTAETLGPPRPGTEVLDADEVWAASAGAPKRDMVATEGRPDGDWTMAMSQTAPLLRLRSRSKVAGWFGAAVLVALLGALALLVLPAQHQTDTGSPVVPAQHSGIKPATVVDAGIGGSEAGVGGATDLAATARPDAQTPRVDSGAARRPPAERPRRLRPANPAAAVPGNGTISVQAVPWGVVHIDGVNLGATPLLNHRLSAGPHLVEIRAPDSNQIVERREVKIEADRHHKIMVRSP